MRKYTKLQYFMQFPANCLSLGKNAFRASINTPFFRSNLDIFLETWPSVAILKSSKMVFSNHHSSNSSSRRLNFPNEISSQHGYDRIMNKIAVQQLKSFQNLLCILLLTDKYSLLTLKYLYTQK